MLSEVKGRFFFSEIRFSIPAKKGYRRRKEGGSHNEYEGDKAKERIRQ